MEFYELTCSSDSCNKIALVRLNELVSINIPGMLKTLYCVYCGSNIKAIELIYINTNSTITTATTTTINEDSNRIDSKRDSVKGKEEGRKEKEPDLCQFLKNSVSYLMSV